MLVDLDLKRRRVMIIGGGREAELKATKLVDAGATPTVVAKRFTIGLKKLSDVGSVRLVEHSPHSAGLLVRKAKPGVLFVSTGRHALDSELAELARSCGSLVCVVDTPHLNDFNMPAIAKVGPVRVAMSSGGMSPAMMKVLRKRIEKMIRPEDVLHVELQHAVRSDIAQAFKTSAGRKKMVYEIINDEMVARLLKRNDLRGAKERARKLIRNGRRSKGPL